MWIPLLLLPLLIYNAVAFDLVGAGGLAWAAPVVSISMLSGAIWTMTVADLLVLLALTLLIIETLRGRRHRRMLPIVAAGVVFCLYLGEFLWVPAASTSLFFTCTAMSLADVAIRLFGSVRGTVPRDEFY